MRVNLAPAWSIATALALMVGCTGESGGPLPEESATLTAAPAVPAPITRQSPAKVVVNLEAKEHPGRLDDGVEYQYWTFGGTVPGKFIRIRVGDIVEFHLNNAPDNKMPHNIDLHAVNGPGGGATSSLTNPGHTTTFSFKALNPGLYVYHCATAPVGMHIANGMYGLILVEPEGGLPPVDHEYYVMQGEFYTRGGFGDPGMQPFDMAKALQERPPYVVFNGSVGSLTGDSALTAKVGETVRLYIGNGGPNLISSFHVIGEILDRVHVEAGTLVNENVQTTVIPPGGAAIVEFKVDAPGEYLLVDHAVFRAFNKGALAILNVTGPDDSVVYSGKIFEGVYRPEGSVIQSITANGGAELKATSVAERIEFGKRIYDRTCAACHQPDGKGLAGAFPPLANSDYLNADKLRAISVVIHGRSGKITVNGEDYDGVMPRLDLTDEMVANVLTYVYSQWGNNRSVVTPEEVAQVRETTNGAIP